MKIKNKKGFAIIETLISTLIFLVGFVGMINLTAYMTAESNNSKYRTEAVELSNELSSYILFDRVNISSYTDAAPNTIRDDWDTVVKAKLPNAATFVDYDSTTSELKIKITWQAQSDVDERAYEVITFMGS